MEADIDGAIVAQAKDGRPDPDDDPGATKRSAEDDPERAARARLLNMQARAQKLGVMKHPRKRQQ
jgi:hypothetical protein